MGGPSAKGALAPKFDVLINGASLSVEAQAHVSDITVDASVNEPAMFLVELTGKSATETEPQWGTQFSLGDSVEIKLGFEREPASVFKGEIVGLEPVYRHDGLSRLVIRGFDRLHRMTRGRKSRTFSQLKDSQIVSRVASDSGLTADATDTGVLHEHVYQHNQTDLEFLLLRARRINYEILVIDKTLLFRPAANAESEALTLTFHDDLLEFQGRMSSAKQVSEVVVRGWDVQGKKEIVGRAKLGDEVSTMGGQQSGGQLTEAAFGKTQYLISSTPITTQAEADQIAKAELNSVSLDFITGDCVCVGHPDLKAGKVVKLDGLDKQFSGRYYVIGVTHRYAAARGYRTLFKVRRNAL
jgi:phage protein D